MTGHKTGILTFHRCINYGSYWQSRCLVEALQSRGMNASILDHHSKQVNLAEWRCAYQPVLPTQVPASDYPLYRSKMKRFFEAFEQLPLSPRFSLANPEQMENYDTVIVGSDEVWNLFHPWYGKCPLFYGEGIAADRIISFAASFGNYPSEWGLDPVWASKLHNFDAISVRDENSKTLVRKVIELEADIVLDPCLQFPFTVKDEEYPNLQQPYLALYGHNFSPHFIEAIRKWAKRKSLPIISIGYRNDWADSQWIDAGPLAFPHFIKGAEAVATNFFHGCVFSIRYAKPFACETSSYRNQKITGLLALLGGERHIIGSESHTSTIDACLSEPPVQAIFGNIALYKQRSNDFLDRALKAQQLRVA
ncbi:MAG TPA: polysaccharide pyruvyl transferase family protein [Flavisolibacter sp.]|jgi:hypothetical protein|nr:polysaccharide pyruvyl transferase family protein [Flavisolibacter sp.]